MADAAMNGADALCDTLLGADIDVCFANPGTSEMHFVAALDRKPAMRCVLGLFEGVVTGAADGYGRMAGKPAATLLHCGAGLANGLANLHNARRALTPIVNIVGDHATVHRTFDAPLASDVAALARPMSDWVGTVEAPEAVSRDTCRAIEAATRGAGGVATLVLPADMAWSRFTGRVLKPVSAAPPRVADATVDRVADQLRHARRPVFILGGAALRGPGLVSAGRLAVRLGAVLYAEQSAGRIERGGGRPEVRKTPNGVDAARQAFGDCDLMVLVGARAPVGFFAYPGKPGTGVPETCTTAVLALLHDDVAAALAALLARVAGGTPGVAAPVGPVQATLPPLEAHAALTGDAVIQTVGRHLPAGAILCDETISSGFRLFALTRQAPEHDYLPLTGGAIGIGLPLAAGAAIACPDRKVVLLQADGSGLYTAQALWTQARERLDVLTVVFANRSYALLYRELNAVGAQAPGRNAKRMLDLSEPSIDWVQLARSLGVDAVRAESVAALDSAVRAAMAVRGPHLIEAII